MEFTQIELCFVSNSADANNQLRQFQLTYPKRKIIGVSMLPTDLPMGYFMTITYQVEV